MSASGRASRRPSMRRGGAASVSFSRVHARGRGAQGKDGDAADPGEERIRAALLNSDDLRDPVRLHIRDLSNWFSMRKMMKGRRQSAHVVKRDEGGKSFTAAIFDVVKKDVGKAGYSVAKRTVGVYPTILQAHEACEDACAARDERGPESVGMTGKSLATHYYVRLVHPVFEKLSHSERLDVVYEALLDEFFVRNDPSSPTSEFHDCHMRGYSFVGACVSNLGQFKHLSGMPFQVMLDLQAPKQFRTESSNVTKSFQSYALRNMVKENVPRIPRQRGVFGHFFHDLDSKSKSLMMEEYKENVKLAMGDSDMLERGFFKASVVQSGQKPNARGDPTFYTAVEGMKEVDPLKMKDDGVTRVKDFKMSDPIGSSFSPLVSVEKKLSAFEDLEAEVTTKYHIAVQRVTSSALQLQRIYRLGCLPRTQRRKARRHRAAIEFQRRVRGGHGRRRAADWRAVRDASVLKIQAARRGFVGRREAIRRRELSTNLAFLLQPLVRGWIARMYVIWLRQNWDSAVCMQRIVRGFLGRCHVRVVQIKRFRSYISEAAILIQSIARRFLGRIRHENVLRDWLHRFVVVPCIVLVQSGWRMSLARRSLSQMKKLGNAAKEIQRHARGFLCRSWIRRHSERIFHHNCAARIQGRFRGWIHRDLLQKRRLREHHHHVLIPSAIFIQTHYRGFVQRSKLASRKAKWASAIRIQMTFRRARERDEMKKKWQEHVARIKQSSAIKLQALFRGWRAREKASQMKAREIGRKLVASRIIIRAWRQHRKFHAWKALEEAWIQEQSVLMLSYLANEHAEIQEDLDDIDCDIKEREEVIVWAAKRINELHDFLGLSADRLSTITLEAKKLRGEYIDEDQSSAWMMDMKDEEERLGNQNMVSKEEIRSCKAQVSRAKNEIVQLHRERDSLQVDLENICVREVEELEKQRRREIQACVKQKKKEWEKKVWCEIARWKVKGDFSKNHCEEKQCDIFSDVLLSGRPISLQQGKCMKDKTKQKALVVKKEEYENMLSKRCRGCDERIRNLYGEVLNKTLGILKGGT